MRVIAGRYKGRRLRGLSGRAVRPTPDRLKETLFSILQPRLSGARFLDLCAGTGAVGIEALSRGAQWVTFVESSRPVLQVLLHNIASCGLVEGVEVLPQDALRALRHLRQRGESFDVIFFDPPYASTLYESVLEILSHEPSVITPEGVFIVMHHTKRVLHPRYGELERVREVRQGENVLSFYERRPVEALEEASKSEGVESS